MRDMTPDDIRRIRKEIGFSQEEFARTMWVTFGTVNRWEVGRSAPSPIHLRLLNLLKESLTRPAVRASLQSPRAHDPMFFLYQLLEPLYGPTASVKPRRRR